MELRFYKNYKELQDKTSDPLLKAQLSALYWDYINDMDELLNIIEKGR